MAQVALVSRKRRYRKQQSFHSVYVCVLFSVTHLDSPVPLLWLLSSTLSHSLSLSALGYSCCWCSSLLRLNVPTDPYECECDLTVLSLFPLSSLSLP